MLTLNATLKLLNYFSYACNLQLQIEFFFSKVSYTLKCKSAKMFKVKAFEIKRKAQCSFDLYIYSQLLSPLLSLKCNILACFGKIKINGLLKGFEWGLFHFKSKILFASLAPDARAP